MNLDTKIFFALNDLVGSPGFLSWLTVFFAIYWAYLLGILFLVFLWLKPFLATRWKVFWAGIISVFISRGILTTVIRYFYHHPRPFAIYQVHQLVSESGNSFPSGHASFFFALSMIIFYYNKRWGTAFFVGSIVMGVARVMAGVHYPSDILGGALIGIIVGYFTASLISKDS
ncbi:MAG: phosphatase PAP2 family protein [Minisyncoccia bacterium]